jgi:hypothetical protein
MYLLCVPHFAVTLADHDPLLRLSPTEVLLGALPALTFVLSWLLYRWKDSDAQNRVPVHNTTGNFEKVGVHEECRATLAWTSPVAASYDCADFGYGARNGDMEACEDGASTEAEEMLDLVELGRTPLNLLSSWATRPGRVPEACDVQTRDGGISGEKRKRLRTSKVRFQDHSEVIDPLDDGSTKDWNRHDGMMEHFELHPYYDPHVERIVSIPATTFVASAKSANKIPTRAKGSNKIRAARRPEIREALSQWLCAVSAQPEPVQ